MTDDELLFSDNEDEYNANQPPAKEENWRLLIVDDEPEVHKITKLTLANFQFEGRGLDFLHAHSAIEASEILSSHNNIALMLLDVVMETDHAGLELVHKVRHELQNESIRIVLRTGQPGEAPERDIIANYDINDYTQKTELSAQKLFSIVIASLRSYRDIIKLLDNQNELLRVNQQLADQRERIQVTLDAIGDAVMTTDSEGRITHLNPIAEQLTGWAVDEAKGKDVKEIFPITDVSTGLSIENPIDKVLETGKIVYLSNHTSLQSKSGKAHQITDSAAPIRDANDEIVGMVLVFNDVTEQYQLREAVAKSQHNLQMIMDHSPAVICAKDVKGHYIFVNQKFSDLFQVDREKVVEKTDYDVFPVEFADKFRASDLVVLNTEKALESEETVPLNGVIHYYLSVKFPLFNKDNQAYAVCSISTDITDRRMQEEKLRRSQKMDAIGQLTGGIAHDFNNQLGIVLGYLELLEERSNLNETSRKWISTATKASRRCTDLTRQLLSFSRTQSDEKATVDINVNIKEIQTLLARTLTPSIEIKYLLTEKLWLTEINIGEFQDAVLNLVINARDAMAGAGTLTIETNNKILNNKDTALEEDAVPGKYVQLIFKDNGSGMSQLTQERLFEPFYTTKSKGKGTGLGMAMVYGFVKRFNGLIQIQSEENIGTKISIYFPASTSSAPDSLQANTSSTTLPKGSENILIVDDEIDLLHLAKEYLESLGYQVYLAQNARQALDILSNHADIQLLFSDVVLPGGINGYELAEQANRLYPHLRTLLTSGFTSSAIVHNGQQEYSEQLLPKPYQKTDLALKIRELMDKDK